MKKFYSILGLILLAQIIWAIRLNYPPSLEQLYFPLTSVAGLWFIRLATLLLLLFTFYKFGQLLKPATKPFYWLILAVSPLPFFLWFNYPLSSIKLCLPLLIILKTPPRRLPKIAALVITIALILFINKNIQHQAVPFFSQFSLTGKQIEITDRFNKETLLTPGNPVPLTLKRVAYNKYYFVIKGVSESVLRFFDMETFFFQEIHPLYQKSVPLFFYGALPFFVFALWYLVRSKLPTTGKEGLLFLTSLVAFLLTDDFPFLRFSLAFFLILILISQTLPLLIKSSLPLRLLTYFCLVFVVYGALANWTDRTRRPYYWLDNRPLIYQKYFNDINLSSYSAVNLADILGYGAKYCRYYHSPCSKINFANYDLTQAEPENGVLYIGFLGNLFGVDPYRNYENWDESFLPKDKPPKVIIIKNDEIRDNPVNGYGHRIVFAIKNPDYVKE